MRRILIVLAGFAVVSIAAESRLSGQTSRRSASLTVSATVSKNCTISTAPVTFGAYDSVTANATAPLDGIGTVTVTCTKGAAAKVGLNAGGNAQGTTRRMAGTATEYLTLRTLQGHRTCHRLGRYRRRRPRCPCGAEPEPAELHRLRTRASRPRRHGRQLHRYRRGDGEFLRDGDHATSPHPRSHRGAAACASRRDRVQLHRHADGGRPLGVGDQRARHVAQCAARCRCDSRSRSSAGPKTSMAR